jgi:hypothetical protein
MVKREHLLEQLEVAHKSYVRAHAIWTERRAELKETQAAVNQAFKEERTALAFLEDVERRERRLEVVDIIDDDPEEEEDEPPPNVVKKNPSSSGKKTDDVTAAA